VLSIPVVHSQLPAFAGSETEINGVS